MDSIKALKSGVFKFNGHTIKIIVEDDSRPDFNPDVGKDARSEEIDFAFLFASPLINSEDQPMAPISYQVEYEVIKKHFEGRRLRKVLATRSNLNECANQKPKIIHFSGHGDKDLIFLEDENGRGDPLKAANLKNIIQSKRLAESLAFVFVAACHSERIGQIFSEAQIAHVICVEESEQIADEACCQFTNYFYNNCLSGKFTICESFIQARDNFPGLDKFTLLSHHDPNKCKDTLLDKLSTTPLRNEDQVISIDCNPEICGEHYFLRNKELHELISSINRNKISHKRIYRNEEINFVHTSDQFFQRKKYLPKWHNIYFSKRYKIILEKAEIKAEGIQYTIQRTKKNTQS
jgi:hypothetical protein